MERVQTKIDVEKQRCPCCRACESKCPNGTIQVNKFIQGKITINSSKCPEDCKDCLDICPITGTLYLSESDKKVHINEMFCVYCGACKAVCPVEDALELKRTKINHTPVSSGAWNKALERLTSTTGMSKELKAKGSHKAVKSVGKLLIRTEA
jgi:4Fe-4S ferredoxin